MPVGEEIALACATETFDSDGFHSTSIATPLITIPTGGAGIGERSMGLGGHRRSAVYTSDLMPHWGAEIAGWEGLPGLLRALVGLVATS